MIFIAMMCAAIAEKTSATQHLIDSGDNWQRIVEIARPGDEILLLPGEHKQAVLDGLRGTAQKPITIRGLDPNNRPMFHAPIALLNPRHVVLENLDFERCDSTAILIGPGAMEADVNEDAIGHVVLRNLRISRTGSKASSRVIEMTGLLNVTIADCTFDGWSGRAIDVVGCDSVTIQRCTFTGVDKYNAELAVAMRGGSRECIITNCRFERAGQTCAVSLGGRTSLTQFAELTTSSSSAAQVYEATQCRVLESYFIDQPCPILMAHTDRSAVRNCTILQPKRWLFAMISLHQDPRVARNTRPTFGNNLVEWTAGELTGLLLLDEANRGVDLVLESNLWWSNEPADVRRRMLPTIGADIWPQTIDINPRLNDRNQPQVDDATMFGVRSAE